MENKRELKPRCTLYKNPMFLSADKKLKPCCFLNPHAEWKIFKDIIEQIYKDNYQSEFSYFLCGLDKNDSLCSIFNDFSKREVQGNIYSVSYDHSKKTLMPANYYIEAARI